MSENTATQGEVVIYQTEDGSTKLDVCFVDETVWLTQAQSVALFKSSKANISEHIRNIYAEGELEEGATVRKFRTVQYGFYSTCRKFRQVQSKLSTVLL